MSPALLNGGDAYEEPVVLATKRLRAQAVELIDEVPTVDVAEEEWKINIRGDATFVTDAFGERPAWFWTGKRPVAGTPGISADGSITSLPLPDLSSCTRQQALDYFDNSWCLTEVIFSALQGEEAFYRPPYHNLRHPFIFYYGHPAALYVNKLRVAGILKEPVNPHFEFIFETGVDEMSWDDLSKNSMVWPSVREVTEYRRTVYQLVAQVIRTHPAFASLPITWIYMAAQSDSAWAIFMGFEHERIHLETSSVLMRELPLRLLVRPKWWPADHPSVAGGAAGSTKESARLRMLPVPAGDVTIGKPHDWPSFGWDNEYGRRTFHVRAFAASSQLISNGEFLEFVRDGGYRCKAWWGEDGWKWRTFRNAKWPAFWVPDGPAGLHQYKLRLIFEVVPMAPALPAVVNVHEARAFASWASARAGKAGEAAFRLLTEPEAARLRNVVRRGADGRAAHDPVMHLSGKGFKGQANLNMAYGSECAVNAMEPTPAGFFDTQGNLWQWCEDKIASLPESRGVHVLYDDFSTPCYDGEHHIIVGGSFMSTGDEASVFSRFHFRPHFFQHAGFRLVSGSGPFMTSDMDSPPPHVGNWDPSTSANKSATNARDRVDQQLLTHFAPPAVGLAGAAAVIPADWLQFPARCAAKLAAAALHLGLPRESALEVGCSVGGAVVELSRCGFGKVMGVDLSADCIAAANEVAQRGIVRCVRKDQGHCTSELSFPVAADAAARKRCTFKQMDPCCLAPDLGAFDAVLLANLVERVASPKSVLGRMAGQRGLVKLGGLLMVTSTFSWSEKVSDPQLWLGGRKDATGKCLDSAEGLKALLAEEFELVSEEEMPLVQRLEGRKYDLMVSQATIWRRIA